MHKPIVPTHVTVMSLLMLLLTLLALLPTPVNSAKMAISFCNEPSDPDFTQPSNQLERFQTLTYSPPTLNFTWSPSSLLCLNQVRSYHVDVTSNSRIINAILKAFGGFPQNTCDQVSKANDSMLCEGRPCNACAEPWEEGCSNKILNSDFKVSRAMVRAASLFNLNFAVKAYGEVDGLEGEVVFWCMDFKSGEEGAFVIDTLKKNKDGEGGGEEL
ncbi:hypothetical protein TL16_g12546 [Triparma laevis f. inornata]|uniref:Uncharacterized protein n=1 Tax=Triparma laevis f. inornata TaxID=1714386 RepID=A0A9W7BL00_9STRA|nr:hypothetical protein TL16_g12546 [Triparma laevis f. inornata]